MIELSAISHHYVLFSCFGPFTVGSVSSVSNAYCERPTLRYLNKLAPQGRNYPHPALYLPEQTFERDLLRRHAIYGLWVCSRHEKLTSSAYASTPGQKFLDPSSENVNSQPKCYVRMLGAWGRTKVRHSQGSILVTASPMRSPKGGTIVARQAVEVE